MLILLTIPASAAAAASPADAGVTLRTVDGDVGTLLTDEAADSPDVVNNCFCCECESEWTREGTRERRRRGVCG